LASLPERIAAASPPARFARVADPLNDLQGSGRIIEHRALAKAGAGSPALKFKAMKPK